MVDLLLDELERDITKFLVRFTVILTSTIIAGAIIYMKVRC